MKASRILVAACGVVVSAAACGGSNVTTPPPNIDCSTVAPTALAVGAQAIIDPTTTGGCLNLPAASAGGAEHLIVALSTAGTETGSGVQGTYSFAGQPGASVPANPSAARLHAFAPPSTAGEFHRMLRERERAIAADPASLLPNVTKNSASAPVFVGDHRAFQVCADPTCTGYVTVTATAKFVGLKGAIFLDDTVPTGGYLQSDIDAVGTLFDGPAPNMYSIDTTAFGRESDIDNNGVVIILLSDQINKLSGNCSQTGSVILGYFFGNDLTNNANSNHGEVFYGLVPDPNNVNCQISASFAIRNIAPTFIHEFQHMISFNQHVLVQGGSAEETWLNEGLSHYAEYLGGSELNASQCDQNDCFSQFSQNDLSNAFNYLNNPEQFFLIEPLTSQGGLEERGANWLFVRWFTGAFAADSVLGTDMTRALVQTNLTGAANVSTQSGVNFSTLVTQWQMANYLESRPGFSEPTGRLHYKSIDLAADFGLLGLGAYPLAPDITTSGNYSRTGTLKAGSGPQLRVVQGASALPVKLQVTTSNSATVQPRIGVVRLQ
ncbi:MAG: hypothetical protein ABJD11_00895 [Gemmatimonadota bacterium]